MKKGKVEYPKKIEFDSFDDYLNKFNKMIDDCNNEERSDSPSHYQGLIETIDIIESITDGVVGLEAFCLGNCVKYLSRYKSKGGVEDLKKAKNYLERLIKMNSSESN